MSVLEQQIEKLQRCIETQNEVAAQLSEGGGDVDITFTMVAISTGLGEVVDTLSQLSTSVIR